MRHQNNRVLDLDCSIHGWIFQFSSFDIRQGLNSLGFENFSGLVDLALNQSRRQTLESFTNINIYIDQAWYTMQNVSVGDTSAVQGGGFSPPTPHLKKIMDPSNGIDQLQLPQGIGMENFPKKNRWGKPSGDQRRKAAKVVWFCFHSEVSKQIFFRISSDPIAWVKIKMVLC